MTEENLISPPPRDSLILRRMDALKTHKIELAQESFSSYLAILKKFTLVYFKGKVRWDDLSKMEKKELANICLRHSIRNLFYVFSPYVAGLVVINLLVPKNPVDIIGSNILSIMFAILGVSLTNVIQDAGNYMKSTDSFRFIRIFFCLKKQYLPEEDKNER